jgi:hypothetical protein
MADTTKATEQNNATRAPLVETRLMSYRWLTWTVKYYPWFLFAFVFVNYFFINNLLSDYIAGPYMDEIQLSGLAVAGIGFFALNTLLQKASTMLNDLWLRGVFQVEDRAGLAQFSNSIERLAHNPWWQLSVVIFLVGIIAASTVFRCYARGAQGTSLLYCQAGLSGVRTSKAIVEFITALLLAPLLWRTLVVAWSISKLGQRFNLNVIWSHPDKSGGFLPVGTICLWLAVIVAIPATALGVALIYCQTGTNCSHIPDISQALIVYEQVLLIVIILSLVSFFWPLWSFHKAMEKEKREIEQAELSTISQHIDLISKTLVANAEKITRLNEEETQKLLAENEVLENKLTVLQNTYANLNRLPVWPFDKNTIIKVASSQAVPVLGLTGIGADILDVLNYFLSLGRTP